MNDVFMVVVSTAIIFFAVLIATAKSKQNKGSGKFTAFAALFASVGGLFIYGYAYSQLKDNFILAVFFTLLSTVKMFMGQEAFGAISSVDFMQNSYMILLFWVIHITAIYSTASAVLATIGAPALKKIRVWLYKRKSKINIIYGINDNSLHFASELMKDEDSALIIIDDNLDSLYTEAINELGCLYFVGNEAVNSDIKFVKRIGVDRDKVVCVYALDPDEPSSLNYVYKLKDTMKELGVEPNNTSLTLMANMEMEFGSDLQHSGEKYGYGSVLVFDRAYLAAHVLLKKYPPCDYLEFDTVQAKAVEGEVFSSVIVGFGKVGQAVLKNIVINGQFEGCDFKTAVFDTKIGEVSGYVLKNNASMVEEYAIDLRSENAQERAFFDYIEDNADTLDYIVVCTGDEDTNSEIAGEIQSTLGRLNTHAQVFQCSYDNIIHQRHDISGEYSLEITKLYTIDNLDISIVDKEAMALNHIYCGGQSAQSDWNNARFVDRMSSRASANFIRAYLRLTGFTEEEVVNEGKWESLTPLQIENLSKTEHLRWCSFFYSLGYRTMSEAVFDERCGQYLREIEDNGTSKIKIQKDDVKFLHACLIDWDELDELTEKYRAVTGDSKKDYKVDDTNNVMLLPQILKASNDK